jgi:hypothetical protein
MIRVECVGRPAIEAHHGAGPGAHYETGLSSSMGAGLSRAVCRDLVRVGHAAFLADRAFRRGRPLGGLSRELSVTVAVEEPDRWSEVADLVAALASFVSQDQWQFQFVATQEKTESTAHSFRPSLQSSVSLFSDGLDSLCGAAAVLQRGEAPIFVSLAPPGLKTARARVTELASRLGLGGQGAEYFSFRLRVSDQDPAGNRSLFPERSRRTRPMLFLSLAGAVAAELAVTRIRLNENGVLAVNLPVQDHVAGSLISRHAHPETLRRFEALLIAIWPHPSRPMVENLFADQTKGEELGVLGAASALTPETISCEYGRQQMATQLSWLKKHGRYDAKTKECGLCMPCIIRRSALAAARITEPREHYVFDARKALRGSEHNAGAPLYRSVAHNPIDLLDFCHRIQGMKASQFALAYLPELTLLSRSIQEASMVIGKVHHLYQRFASEIISYLES